MDYGCGDTTAGACSSPTDAPPPPSQSCGQGKSLGVFVHVYEDSDEDDLRAAVLAANAKADCADLTIVCNPPIAGGPEVSPSVALGGLRHNVRAGETVIVDVSGLSFNSPFDVVLETQAGAPTVVLTGTTAEGYASLPWTVPASGLSGDASLVVLDLRTGRGSQAWPIFIGASTPTVRVDPASGDVLADCIDQGGSGFPPVTALTLVFHDPIAGVTSRENAITTDADGAFAWRFGLGPGCDDNERARAQAYLDRVDSTHVGFSNRPAHYWAEYWDGALRTSNTVDYALSAVGSCTPSCASRTCGTDGCGGFCGTCTGTQACIAGACAATAGPVISVCGTISGTTTWTTAMSPVVVTCDTTITGQLTIEPGVMVQFDSARDLFVAAGASLIAVGTAGDPIVFTSDGPAVPQSWGGIDLDGGAAQVALQHVELRHGGALSSGNDFPIIVSGRLQPTVDHVRFVGNRRNALGLKTGTYTSDLRLNVVGIPYYVEGEDLVVNPGVTMTVDPGVVIRVEDEDLILQGRLVARGTAARPIVFTSYRDDSTGGDANGDGSSGSAASDWGGIWLYNDVSLAESEITNAAIRFGGKDSSSYARFPIRLPGTIQPVIENVTLENNRRNAIGLSTGTYSVDLRLNVVGIPYYVEADDIVVNSGVTMTVDPGVVVKVQDDGTGVGFDIQGRLVANGTPLKPIVFTSYRHDAILGDSNGDGSSGPASEDWGGIILRKDPALPSSELTHVRVLYGGEDTLGGAAFPIKVTGRTQPRIEHVELSSNRRNALGLFTGTYTSDLRLNVLGIPYYVQEDDVVVNAGVTMTVDPGVVVKLEAVGGSYPDIVVNGRLVANGTATLPITFTSSRDDGVRGDSNGDGATAPAASQWGGIVLARDPSLPASELSHATVRYGGNDYFAAGYPIRLPGTTQPLIHDVTLSGNRRNALGLTTGAYAYNLRLNVVGIPYYVYKGDITVNAGVTMAVDPGVVMKFEPDTGDYPYVYVQGRLIANGSAELPIIFTSFRDDAAGGDSNGNGATAPAAEDWGGIALYHDPSLPPSELSHATIRYGGNEYYQETGFPLWVTGRTQPLVHDLTLTANRRNAIGLGRGTYSADLRLNIVGIPYYVEGADVIVNSGVTMTIDPGVILKLQDDAACCTYDGTDIVVHGTLLANGTAAQPITLTSYRDDSAGGDSNGDGAGAAAAEDWGGVRLEATSTASRLEHVRLAFGGEDFQGADCALRVVGSAPLVQNVVFASNEDALCIYSDGRPDLGGGALGSTGGNRFEAGNAWAVYNDSTYDITAHGNWWGFPTASQIDAVIRDELDEPTRGRVLFGGYQDCNVGSACTDFNPCTQSDVCVAGHCDGAPYSCQPPGLCEKPSGVTCNGDGTCTYPADVGKACDDGVDCTSGDSCRSDRACAGTAYTCGSPPTCHTATGVTCDGEGGCDYPLAPPGSACGDATAAPCSGADTCDGLGVCSDNDAPPTQVCRPSTGACDPVELCDGAGGCPSDALAPLNTPCGDSVASTCTAPDSCDGQGMCRPNHAAALTLCRAATGECDVAEVCLDGKCPVDAFKATNTVCGDPSDTPCTDPDRCNARGVCLPNDAPSTLTCRPSAGACDIVERCDGQGACAEDLHKPAGTACGDATNTECTDPDSCDGAGICRSNDAPPTIECRAAAGDCDIAENCDGQGRCPGDARLSAGTSCGDPATTPCTDPDTCDGNGRCLSNDASATVVCRAASGPCDVAERCTGDDGACPADALAPLGASCRDESCAGAAAVAAGFCDGDGAACPAAVPEACWPYECGGDGCRTSCSHDGDCAPGVRCDGAGRCEPGSSNGSGCEGDGDCASGVCADEVCCDIRCEGACEACDVAGHLGTCIAVSGQPHGDRPGCAGDGGGCAGSCDGVGRTACSYPVSVPCRAGSCADDVATLAAFCMGDGHCPEVQRVACAPFRCGDEACNGDCAADGDCGTDSYCAAGLCMTARLDGESCGRAEECVSGLCVDGVCCDTRCDGQCEACDLAAARGRCSAVAGNPRGVRAPCISDGMCGGACDGVGREGCAYPAGDDCGVPSCDGASASQGKCDGAGRCSVTSTDCAPFGCSGGACLAECVGDRDCASDHVCVVRTCVALDDSQAEKVEAGDDGSAQSGSANGCGAGIRSDLLLMSLFLLGWIWSIAARRSRSLSHSVGSNTWSVTSGRGGRGEEVLEPPGW